MSIRYLDFSGALSFWTNIKNYILSKIPTKTSELTNDSGFLTQHQSLSNYVTLNSEQTITGKKLFTNSTTQVNSVNTFTGSTLFIDASASVPRGSFPESAYRVGRIYIGDGTSYNGSWFIIDPTIDTDKAYYRMVTTNPDNTDNTRFSICWDGTETGARCRKNISTGDLLPYANNTYNLGSNNQKWDIGYIHNLIGTNKENLTEDANDYYSTTSGSHMTFYTTTNGGTKLSNVPAAVNTHLESRTIRYLSSSDWIVEQICHNSTGLYYRKGTNGTWEDWKTFAFTNSNITGNASTATKFSANKDVTLTGDVTGTASSKAGWSVSTTLSNSGVTAGTYGPSEDVTGDNNATISVPQITVDAKGRVTSVTNRTLTCKNNTYNVYNKTLTIQKNGTNVATFTSNSNTNVTANITVPTKTSELTNDSNFLTTSSSLNASKLTGTIDIARLPQGALERVITVANQTARFALTTSSVQLGDTVKQLDTGVMYVVVDESKLNSNNGYLEYTAGSASSVPWSGITSKPTEFTPSSHTHTKSEITDFPTNVSAFTNDAGYLTSHQSLSNYVTLNTAQEITSAKTFKDTTTARKLTSVEAGNVIPSSDKLISDIWQDKNGKELGRIYYVKSKSGTTGLIMRAGDWFTSNEGVYTLDASGTSRRAELHLYSDASGNCCIKPVGYFSATLKPLSSSVWLGESTNPFGSVFANQFRMSNPSLEPNVDVSTNEEHSIGFFGKNSTPLSYITFQKRTGLTDRVAVRIQTASSTYKSYCFDANCLYPEVDNSLDIGSSSKIFKNIYCNNYYKGTTAFGDIVTHNASEFLTSHQSLANYVTTNTSQSISGIKTFPTNINLANTSTSQREYWALKFSKTDTNGAGASQIGVYQPSNSNNFVACLRLGNPRGDNKPTTGTGVNTSSCWSGIGVYYNYALNRGYPYAPSCNSWSDSSNADAELASTAWVRRYCETTKGFLTSHQSLANYVTTNTDQSISGIKSFSDDTYIKSLNFTTEVESASSSSSAVMPIITTITYGDSSPSVQARLNLRVTADGVKSFFPHDNNVSLGLSTRVWSDFFAFHGYFRGQQQGDEYSTNARTNLTLLANRDTSGQSCCVVDTFRENTTQGTGMHILGFGMKENSIRYEGVRFQWIYDSVNSGYNFNLKPNTQGTNKPLTYNLGTSTDKWNSVYSLNYYYGSNNTEFSDKFVTTDTSQTIVSNKTFVGSQYFKDNNVQYFGIDFSKGTAPSAYTARCTYFSPLTGGGSTYQTSNGLVGCAVNNDNVVTTFMHAIKNTAGATTRTSFVLYYDTDNDKRSVTTNGDFLPILNGQGIGNSTNKWKTFNGVEPSSLGMPSGNVSDFIDISSYFSNTGSEDTNTYTAIANGWIYLRLGNINACQATILDVNNNRMWGQSSTGSVEQITIPILKDQTLSTLWITGSSVNVATARFIPCQGNV